LAGGDHGHGFKNVREGPFVAPHCGGPGGSVQPSIFNERITDLRADPPITFNRVSYQEFVSCFLLTLRWDGREIVGGRGDSDALIRTQSFWSLGVSPRPDHERSATRGGSPEVGKCKERKKRKGSM